MKVVYKLLFSLAFIVVVAASALCSEPLIRLNVSSQTGENYNVVHPTFANGMKVRSDGLRFQKGQTSFVFSWKDIKKLQNTGKEWKIDFVSGMSDCFELGISMDLLLGTTTSYDNWGDFQIYTRHIHQIDVSAKENEDGFSPNSSQLEIILKNGERLIGKFSQDHLFIDSGNQLVKIHIDEISSMKFERIASESVLLNQ